MGYDLKAGFMLRGYGGDPAFPKWTAGASSSSPAMFAFVVAGVVVLLSYRGFFAQNLVAPVDRVYVATIKAGASFYVAQQLVIWAIPGAIIQFLGGPRRQLGVLLATGLLIAFPMAGWAVLVGVLPSPRGVGTVREERGHGGVRRRRHRGRFAVRVLLIDVEGGDEVINLTPPPLEGLGREADQGWGEGGVVPA